MKQGECSVCEGLIEWDDVLLQVSGVQYCEACYNEKEEKEYNELKKDREEQERMSYYHQRYVNSRSYN